VLLVSGQIRQDQVDALCIYSQQTWDTIDAVIQEAEQPSVEPSSLDKLVIPDGTDAQVIEILRQLTVAEKVVPSDTPLTDAHGPRPYC
jgi:hypothetical protein